MKDATQDRVMLQPLVWPDPAVCTETPLFFRMEGPAGQSQFTGRITFVAGAKLKFDTYFNLFNLGKWQTHCSLQSLGLQLKGEGQICLTLFSAEPDRSWRVLHRDIYRLGSETDACLDLQIDAKEAASGVLFFEITALENGHLDGGAWYTFDPPKCQPRLALSVTTFKREAAVAQTVARFSEFVETSSIGPNLHMFVVDNGKSAGIANTRYITSVDNENLGGAGGFARGILEARAQGYSHCLFMDDDASTSMDAIERSWVFLAYADDPSSAVAGAMITNRHAWAIWENGALFDRICRPQHGGTDLRDIYQLVEMECQSTPRRPHNFYGGWWFFAFPLDMVRHLPFPFFVRGDDVSFSLVHDFNVVTLPGVVSFQESFTEKDTPLTWYLDLRSHLAHHLSLPSMDIGAFHTTSIAVLFWGRTFLTCHYDTMAAVNLAIEDVLRGPKFFADNADMADRRARLGAMRETEKWVPCTAPPGERVLLNPDRWMTRTVMRLSLNGLLIPFFSRMGNRQVLSPDKRWRIRSHWGAAQTTYYDAGAHRAYTVRHDKWRALRLSLQTAGLVLKLYTRHASLKRAWQSAYGDLTSQAFWQRKLGLNTEAEPVSKAAE